jgi:hypothetical protein
MCELLRKRKNGAVKNTNSSEKNMEQKL